MTTITTTTTIMTTTTAPGTFVGNLTYTSSALIKSDYPTASTYTVVTGSIDIRNLEATFTLLFLPALRAVNGYIFLAGNAGLSNFTFAMLTSVGLDLYLGNHLLLTAIVCPALTSVGGFFYVLTSKLYTLSLPLLANVSGSLSLFSSTGTLTVLSLPSLVDVGKYVLVVDYNSLLTVDFTSLAKVGGYMQVYLNGGVTSLSAPSLTSVGDYFTITDCGSLTSISMPVLTSVGSFVQICSGNSSLATPLNILQVGTAHDTRK